MQLQLNTTYKRVLPGKNTKTLFFEWLGYSLNGLERFLIWSDTDLKKEAISLPKRHISDLTIVQ